MAHIKLRNLMVTERTGGCAGTKDEAETQKLEFGVSEAQRAGKEEVRPGLECGEEGRSMMRRA